jgi:hypothetical protein
MDKIATVICFLMCVVNISFIVQDPTKWWNWTVAVVCFGLGVFCLYIISNTTK